MMRIDQALRVVREQTIPALRGSGGDGHAEAIEAVLAQLAEARETIGNLGRDNAEMSRLWEDERAEVAKALHRTEIKHAETVLLRFEVERLRAELAELEAEANEYEREATRYHEEAQQAETKLKAVVGFSKDVLETLTASDSLLTLVRHRYRNGSIPDDVVREIDDVSERSRRVLAALVLGAAAQAKP